MVLSAISAADAIVERLARESRRILSEWRALILLRRATFELAAHERRWTKLPSGISDIRPVLYQMERRGQIRRSGDHRGIYLVTVPYAPTSPPDPYEILMEAHPYAAVGYLSALDVHGLTREQPKRITAIVSKTAPAEETPIGTEPRDWQGIDRVAGRRVSSVSGIPVHWRQLAPERYFGAGIYQPYGFSLRATTPERTLLDVLQDPELGGGFENVLEAWSRAIDTFDLDLLIAYVERFDIGVLRQRVGFLLEELGISHPMLDRWRAGAQRGGSSKLVAANAYAPTYSERWNLSINAPIGVLSSIT